MPLERSYDEKVVRVMFSEIESLSIADAPDGKKLVVALSRNESIVRFALPIGNLKDFRDYYDAVIAARPELIAEMDG